MTTIIGLQLPDCAIVGVDTMLTYDQLSFPGASTKIAQNGAYVVATFGPVRFGNLLRVSWNALNCENDDTEVDDFDYLVTDVVPHLRNICADQGVLKTQSDGGMVSEGGALLAYRGSLYELGQDFALLRPHIELTANAKMFCLGSGQGIAAGAMLGLLTEEPAALERLDMAQLFVASALRITARLDRFTGGPFDIWVQHHERGTIDRQRVLA